jgi:hypothetical protein
VRKERRVNKEKKKKTMIIDSNLLIKAKVKADGMGHEG